MNIKKVFKKYPENEPSFKGVCYLTLNDFGGTINYSVTYFNDNSIFELQYGNVVAFTEKDPRKILNKL